MKTGRWPIPGGLAFICPRYGLEVLGGAETVVRQLAEHLARRDLEVDVLTTCAVDHYTWANYYPPGEDTINGVRVKRFPIQHGEGRMRKAIGDRITAGLSTSYEEQEMWINDSFRSAQLFHFLMDNHGDYHTLVLTPYMFWTTYACSKVAPHKNVLRPCLHDESFARLEIYKSMFRDARGIVFNTPPEADLARRLFDLPRHEVAGEGIDVPSEWVPERFRSKFGIQDRFLLYSGRREWGKNVEVLVEYFKKSAAAQRHETKLVLTGRGDVEIPKDPSGGVIDLGYVEPQDLADAMAAASVVCQPSRWESFSRLVMDGWLGQTPVLGFGGCEVTKYHIERCGGGLIYNDFSEFEIGLDLLLESESLSAEMGRRGREYVLENYTWDGVIDRFVDSISAWAAEDVTEATPA